MFISFFWNVLVLNPIYFFCTIYSKTIYDLIQSDLKLRDLKIITEFFDFTLLPKIPMCEPQIVFKIIWYLIKKGKYKTIIFYFNVFFSNMYSECSVISRKPAGLRNHDFSENSKLSSHGCQVIGHFLSCLKIDAQIVFLIVFLDKMFYFFL